jgi:hypothetical protein
VNTEFPKGITAKGNLLLDLRSPGIDLAGGSLGRSLLDAQDVLGDSVSRAVAFSLTTDTAEVLDTVGLVTAFQFYPTPILTVRYETNNVILTWPTWPKTFRLQWSDTVGPSAAWSDYPEPIGGGDLYQELILPATSLNAPKFFRLYWNTPQPLGRVLATVPVELDTVKNP